MHAETRGRGRVLADTVAGLQWRYGNAAVHRGAEPEDAEADRWATGIPTLDLGLTPGGLPRGRVTLLQAAAPGVSGRLTLLAGMAARASHDGEVVYVDVAASLDPGFLADLGASLAAPPAGGRWREGLPWRGPLWLPAHRGWRWRWDGRGAGPRRSSRLSTGWSRRCTAVARSASSPPPPRPQLRSPTPRR